MVGNYTELNKQIAHIVFLTPGFAEDETDSFTIPAIQIFLRELQQQFNGKISIISFQFPRKVNNYQWNGINIYALGGNNKKAKKPFVWKKAKRLFKQLNEEIAITHIHSLWMGECALVASQLAKKYGIQHNCTLMGQDVLSDNPYFKKIKVLPQLITLSKFHSECLKTNHQLTSNIIPWGVPDRILKPSNKTIDLIVVSSLIPLKCVHEFVATAQGLKKEFPNINCKIIGDGPLKKKLERQIETAGLENNIELLGILAYDETQQLIAQSRILIHLSNFESFGMVVIEALSLNTKVIAKPVGIAKELKAVFKVNTIDETIVTIKEIFSQKDEVQATNFSIDKTVELYLNLFNE